MTSTGIIWRIRILQSLSTCSWSIAWMLWGQNSPHYWLWGTVFVVATLTVLILGSPFYDLADHIERSGPKS